MSERNRRLWGCLVIPGAVLAVLLALAVVVLDSFANPDSDHPRVESLHELAPPMGTFVAASIVVAAYAWCIYAAVGLGMALVQSLRIAVSGRSAIGTVTKDLGTKGTDDNEGGPTQYWEVQFNEPDGASRLTEYSVIVVARRPIGLGSTLRVRYHPNWPNDVWVRRTGVSGFATSIVNRGFITLIMVTIWAFLASVPVFLVYWGVKWVYGWVAS